MQFPNRKLLIKNRKRIICSTSICLLNAAIPPITSKTLSAATTNNSFEDLAWNLINQSLKLWCKYFKVCTQNYFLYTNDSFANPLISLMPPSSLTDMMSLHLSHQAC